MNLRELAEADLAITLEDGLTGFGWPVTLTTPAGVQVNVTAQSNDISLMVDPQTGVLVSGRQASATVRISTLYAQGVSALPFGEPRRGAKPWLAQFNDINGQSFTFKVVNGEPDRALGVIVLLLEAWQA
jgi:hypothetical protein